MSNTIKIKRSTTSDTPSELAEGELAYSSKSSNLFIGTNEGADVVNIGGKIGTTVQGYSADTVIDSTYVATANDFTTTLKDKLDAVADSANNYSLPAATDSVAGGIKVGTNLTIDATTGVLSAQDSYVLPEANALSLGGVKVSVFPENSLVPIRDADSKISSMGIKIGRRGTDAKFHGIEVSDYYNLDNPLEEAYRALGLTPDSVAGGTRWTVEDVDGVAQDIIHDGNLIAKIPLSDNPIEQTPTGESNSEIGLSKEGGKLLYDRISNIKSQLDNTYQKKYHREDGLRFDFAALSTDVIDFFKILLTGQEDAVDAAHPLFKIKNYLEEIPYEPMPDWKRGDLTENGITNVQDMLVWLTFDDGKIDFQNWLADEWIVQPILEDPDRWPEYFTPAFVDTESLIPAANITEGTNTTFVTAAERTKWDAAATWHGTMTTDDEDEVINTVQELIAVFNGAAEDLSVATSLGLKLDASSTLDGGTFG